MKGYDIEGFKTAVRFLTIFRIGGDGGELNRENSAAALPFFPAAGIVAGAVSAAVVIASSLFVSSTFALAALAVAALAVATRGLHLDGVGDCFDALHYYGDREKALSVMKDKSLGAFGAAAVAFVIAAKTVALGSVSPESFITALVVVPAVARFAPALIAYMSESDSSEGLGGFFRFGGDGEILLRTAAVAFAAAFVLGGFGGAGLAIVVSVAAFFLLMFFRSAFGEPTGDVHGAMIELCEVAGFIVAGKML